jgi:hypothetical protein
LKGFRHAGCRIEVSKCPGFAKPTFDRGEGDR